MPVASGTARTRFGIAGWGTRRAGSFAGKALAAPTVFVWNGSTDDGDLGTAANWDGGVAPNAGSIMMFSGTSKDVTSNTGAAAYTAMVIGPEYTGNMSLSTNFMTFGVVRIHKRVGTVNFNSNVVITKLYITGTAHNSGNAVTIGGPAVSVYIHATGGTVRINGFVTNLFATPSPSKFVKVSLGPGSIGLARVSKLRVYGNAFFHDCESGAEVHAWIIGGNKTAEIAFIEELSGTTSPMTELNIGRGGKVLYRSDFTITKLNQFGGVFDAARSESLSFTITDVDQFGGSIRLEGPGSVILTNPLAYEQGEFIPPKGSNLTYA